MLEVAIEVIPDSDSDHVFSNTIRSMGVCVGATGLLGSMSANRISYILGLQGPSILMDTACSSGLVALDLGIAMMSRGQCACSIAVAIARPVGNTRRDARDRHMLASSGRCSTFDASADGYIRGEGCGAVYVCPASD
jgi:acyl transferase domain-containing protein